MPDRLRRVASPALRGLFGLLAKTTGASFSIEQTSAPLPADGRPIIFAANHTNSEDIPRIVSALGRHTYVVVSSHPDPGTVNRAALNAYGTIWLRRGDKPGAKVSREAAQASAVAKLRSGIDVLIFPEAVWMPRYSWIDGLPMLPFYQGTVNIARSAQAHLVPVVTEYTADHVCHVTFCESFDYDRFGDDSIAATAELRASMAAVKQAMREVWGPSDEAAFMALRADWRKALPALASATCLSIGKPHSQAGCASLARYRSMFDSIN